MKRLLTLIVCVLLFTHLHANTIPTITKDGTVLTFKTSPFFKDGVLYAPLRDLLPHVNGTLDYSRKLDSYQWIIEGKPSISFKLNSTTIWIDNERNFLSSPILYRSSRVQIPLKDFLTVSGFSVKQTRDEITITTQTHLFKRPEIFQKKAPYELISSTGQALGFKNVPLRLPKFEKDRPVALSIDDQIYDLSSSYFYEGGKLYVDILPILHQEGAQSTSSETDLKLTFQGVTYTFPLNDKKVTISDQQGTRDIFMPSTIIQKDNRFFLPLLSLINILDYGLYWNSRDRVIELLNKVNRVDLVKKDKKIYINVDLSQSFESFEGETLIQAEKIAFSDGYYIDIPNSKLNVPKRTLSNTTSTIQKIKLSQPDPTTVRLKVYFSTPSGIPTVASYTDGLSFTINSILTEIKEIHTASEVRLELISSGPIQPKLTKDSNKLIIDIPESINELPLQVASNSPLYSQIRTSQFSYDPLSSRIVLDFKDDFPTYSTTTKGDHFVLLLKPKKAPQQPATPPQTQRIAKKEPDKSSWKKPKNPINFNHVLSGKTIVVDAGHGGRDPGAISGKRYFEKTYNLDVARRLQKKLTSKGAIVIMTRHDDTSVGLNARTALANKRKADCFVSIHFNSFKSGAAHGTETYYYKYKDKALASHIQRQMVKDLGLKNNGIKRARMYILRHSKMPAALLEPAFMTNSNNFEQIKDPAFRQKLANSIYQGLVNYYND